MFALARRIGGVFPACNRTQLRRLWAVYLPIGMALVAYTSALAGEEIPSLNRALEFYTGGDKVASMTGQGNAIGGGTGAVAELFTDPLPASRVLVALKGLRPEAANAVRGAREVVLYREASPSVVMVVGEDSFGTGTLISSSTDKATNFSFGEVLTNYHVVGDADTVGVIFKPAQEGGKITMAGLTRATVIRVDQVADLALLRVAAVPAIAKPLPLGALSAVSVGADVHAIGHPTGDAWTYTRGFVSQIRRDYAWITESGINHKATVIQTQTPINPGNSGGPLLDENGRLVGVNSFKGEGEGMNYAVSVDDVQRFLAATSNRRAKRAQPRPTTCEPRELSRHRVEDPAGVGVAMDGDCDGAMDSVAVIPDSASLPLVVLIDTNKDGDADVMLVDVGRNGTIDRSSHDLDFDGEYDLVGHYRNGENEPYRFEPARKQ